MDIMINRYDIVLYTLFDREQVNYLRWSDLCLLRSAGDGAGWCILNLLKAFELDDWK